MGHVRVTKAGYLYFDFFWDGKRCREYTELKNTPENMKVMNEAMRKIDSEITLGTFSYSKYFPDAKDTVRTDVEKEGDKGMLFREYALKWYQLTKIEWKPSVRRDFRSTMEGHLIPHFGDMAVAEITKSDLKEFRTKLAELPGRNGTMSNKRINNILMLLRLILNEASEEFDFRSPFATLKRLKQADPEVQPFSLEEVFLFLRTVIKSFYNYYVVRFFTGMRTAEIDGLKWKYVDFINKRILVRETWQNKQWVSPKTSKSVRDIDMFGMVESALLDQKKVTGDRDLVFCNKNGKPFDYCNISKRVWYPTLKKAGLAPRNPYQTRHTAATLWLASGENPEWVAKQLGHANTQMLFKVYSKFIPNLTRQDGSAFQNLFDRKLDEYNAKENGEEATDKKENK
jgi:integrase